MKIGIAGIGKMGHAIVERLSESESELLAWNRTAEKCKDLNSVRIAGSPADLAKKSNIILSILGNDDAINSVYGESNGFCSVNLEGKVVVEFCTTTPEMVKSLETRINSAGGLFLECPVGGTVGPARNGQLLGLAGGSNEAFTAAEPVLRKLMRRLEHLGPVGSGAAMKLSINLPLMVYWGALGEALDIAINGGIEPEQAFDILADSSGAIGAAKTRLPMICDYFVKEVTPSTNFSLASAIKDMKLMEQQISKNDRQCPVISAVRTVAETAADSGFANFDASLVALNGKSSPPKN